MGIFDFEEMARSHKSDTALSLWIAGLLATVVILAVGITIIGIFTYLQ